MTQIQSTGCTAAAKVWIRIGCAVVVLAASAASAQVTVDDFADAQGPLSDPGTAASAVTQAVGSILGAERDMEVTRVSGAGTVTAEVTAAILTFSSPAGTQGMLEVQWDGADAMPKTVLDPGGLGGVDLTAGGRDALAVTVGAATAGAVLKIEVYESAAEVSVFRRVLPAIATPLTLDIAFADFAGNADFTSAGAVVLMLEGTGVAVTVGAPIVTTTAAAAVAATKVDAVLDAAADNDGLADPGEIVEYTLELTSTASGVTAADLSDTVDPNATFVAGSLDTTPLARDDGYACFGNVGLDVPAASGVLANDCDPDAATGGTTCDTGVGLAAPAITAFDAVTAKGGAVTMPGVPDGSFTYDPPAGFQGTDLFSYTIADGEGNVDVATVAITCGEVIWFVDNSGVAPGTGTLVDPFNSLAPLDGAGGGGDPDGPGHCIFVHSGTASYDGGIELENAQRLVGEGTALTLAAACGLTLPPGSKALPATAGARPTLVHTGTAAGDHAIVLAQDNTIRGLDLGATAAQNARLSGGAAGTLTIGEVAVAGAGRVISVTSATAGSSVTFDSVASTASSGSAGIDLSGFDGSFMVSNGAGTDTSIASAAAGISIQGSSGSFSFGETGIGSSGTGVNLGTNSGTFTFDSLTVTTTAGAGLVANSSGTVNIAAANPISATGGAALDIDNTTIGNGGGGAMTFSSLTSTNSSGRGVDLSNLPAFSQLTVTGATTIDNAAAAGTVFTSGHLDLATVGAGSTLTFGTVNINNRNGTGIFLDNVGGTAGFGATTIANPNAAAGYGIRIEDSSAAVTFASATISTTAVGTATTFEATRGLPTSDGDGDAIFLKNNTGSVAINGGTLSDLADNAVDIRNSDSTTLSGVTIQDAGDANSYSTANSAIQWIGGTNLSVISTNVTNVGDDTIAASLVDDHGIRIKDVDGDLTITGSTFDTATGYVANTNATVGSPNRVVEVDNRGALDLDVTVDGSTFKKYDFQGLNLRHIGGSIDAVIGSTTANTFEDINGAAVSTGPAQQSATGNVHGLLVEDNTFTRVGIAVEVFSARGNTLSGNRGTHATIRNNTITDTISDAVRLAAFAADGGSPVAGSQPPLFRASVTGNTITGVARHAPNMGGGSAFFVAAEDGADSDVTVSGHTMVTGGAGGGTNAQMAITTQNQRGGDLDLVLQNNTFSGFTTAFFGVGFFGNDSNIAFAGTATAVRFGGNNWNSEASIFGETVYFDAFGNTMDVEGYAGNSADSAALLAYLNGLLVDNGTLVGGLFTIGSPPVTGIAVTVTAPLLPPLTP